MAIQNRRGVYGDFDPTKMVPGEFAVVQNGDPLSGDGKSVYIAFNAGNVKRILLDDETMPEGFTDEIKSALLTCFRNVAWINDQGQTYYDALYAALYSEYPKIEAVLNQGTAIIYTDESLDVIKQYLTVTYYQNAESSGNVIPSENYTLTGTLEDGQNNIVVTYNGYSTSVSVNAVDYYNISQWSTSNGLLNSHRGTFENYQPNIIANHSSASRGHVTCNRGKRGIIDSATSAEFIPAEYPIPVPVGATGITVTLPNQYSFGCALVRLTNLSYEELSGTAWSDWGGGSFKFASDYGENVFACIRIKGTSNISEIGAPNPVNITFTFD